MFGYVRPDTPYLYIKDQTLYGALYCGVCKGIGQTCGQVARVGLSYDVAFLSALLHNLLGQDVKIEKQHCVTHCIRIKQMAEVDELTRQLGALNVELAYYKCVDDVQDGDKGGIKKLAFVRGHKRAQKLYPEMCRLVREYMQSQEQVEKAQSDSIGRAADSSATLLAKLSDYFLGEKKTEDSYALFYNLGKWVYLIDALDDYDKDLKKGSYNPFRLAYGAESKCALLKEQDQELGFIFGTMFAEIRQRLAQLSMGFNRDLVENVLVRGLPAQTKKVLQENDCKKCKKRK
jgi:hypothetical protein